MDIDDATAAVGSLILSEGTYQSKNFAAALRDGTIGVHTFYAQEGYSRDGDLAALQNTMMLLGSHLRVDWVDTDSRNSRGGHKIRIMSL